MFKVLRSYRYRFTDFHRCMLLLLAVIVVGNFLRDGERNWLEGALLVVSLRLQKRS